MTVTTLIFPTRISTPTTLPSAPLTTLVLTPTTTTTLPSVELEDACRDVMCDEDRALRATFDSLRGGDLLSADMIQALQAGDPEAERIYIIRKYCPQEPTSWCYYYSIAFDDKNRVTKIYRGHVSDDDPSQFDYWKSPTTTTTTTTSPSIDPKAYRILFKYKLDGSWNMYSCSYSTIPVETRTYKATRETFEDFSAEDQCNVTGEKLLTCQITNNSVDSGKGCYQTINGVNYTYYVTAPVWVEPDWSGFSSSDRVFN